MMQVIVFPGVLSLLYGILQFCCALKLKTKQNKRLWGRCLFFYLPTASHSSLVLLSPLRALTNTSFLSLNSYHLCPTRAIGMLCDVFNNIPRLLLKDVSHSSSRQQEKLADQNMEVAKQKCWISAQSLISLCIYTCTCL